MENLDKFPPLMQRAMKAYVEERKLPGDFLYCVLANDFKGAAFAADEHNLKLLREYAYWLKWEIPRECWGSREAVKNWLNKSDLHK